jgi:hypothetical protein
MAGLMGLGEMASLFDPGGDKLLKLPEPAIVDAVFFQVRNGVAEILRARAPVTAGSRQGVRHFFRASLPT